MNKVNQRSNKEGLVANEDELRNYLKRKMNQKFVSLVYALFIFASAFAQKGYDRRDMLSRIDTVLYSNFKHSYPITRDTLNHFPDSLAIEGEIVDYVTGVSCGVFCGCGTIKIKLIRQYPHYPYEFLFVAVPCFNKFPDGFKTRKIWKVIEIPLNDHSCYWTEVPVNIFDSKGIPFYTLTE